MRWKRILIVGAIAAVVGGIGAASALLLTYHEQTKIDRSDPEVVLIRYLDATFERKDPAIVSLYTCSNPEGLRTMRSLLEEIGQRERDFGVSIQVSPGRMTRVGSAITTDLTIAGTKNGATTSRRVESWRFDLIDESGWRVCSAAQVNLPSPTLSPTTTPSAA